MEHLVLWGSYPHRCLLVFTSGLLLCEIVVGRLCNCLINMVDSFHTLYILIHLTLHPLEMMTGASVTSIANPYTSADLSGPVSQHPTSTTADPTVTLNSSALPSQRTIQPDHDLTGPASGNAVSEVEQYSTLRMQPFGAVVSALLLGSLCISITLEIISHTLQPHVIKRPLVATVVGASSLMFNTLILIWKGGRRTDFSVDGSNLTEKRKETFASSDDTAKTTSQLEGRTTTELQESDHHDRSALEGSLHGGVLMFCNPAAPCVLDPDQHSKESLSSSDVPTAPTVQPPLQSNHAENSISHDTSDCQQPQQLIDPLNEMDNYKACIGHTGWCDQLSSRPKMQPSGCMKDIIAVVHSLLGSILVLANGLAHLLFHTDCLQPHWTCRVLPYLDPAFSLLTVLVLLAVALPEVRHQALVLLQAAPAHVHMEKLMSSIGRVPGVLAVHELHVWQLSETRLVASVHVHCRSGLEASECSELLMTITEVLNAVGVNHCTVQPEFISTCSTNPQSDPQPGSPASPTADTTGQSSCSLRCGKECDRKMCCSPPEQQPCSLPPSTVDVEVRRQGVVIENTYL